MFHHKFAQRLTQIPLGAVLIFPFVLQIAATVGLVSWLSYRNGQQAVNNVASQLRQELVERIQQQIQTYVGVPYTINNINVISFVRGDIDVINPKGEYQFWQQSITYPTTNLIYCGSEQDGSLLGVGNPQSEDSTQLVAYNPSTQHLGYYYSIDEQGNQADLLQKGNRPYDARKRPWYETAKARGEPAWSEIYLDFDTKLPTLTASQPAYDRQGNLLGVCATDFLLPVELNHFLRDLEIGQSGQTFIVERSGILVSSSTTEPLTLETDKGTVLRQAIESNNPLIRHTTLYLIQQFGDLSAIQQSQQKDFMLNGNRHFLQISPFQDERGLDWLIVVVVPEADFMAQIHENTRVTLQLSGLALLLAIALGILTARWITRPIRQITQAASEIAAGQLDQHVSSNPIHELGQLSYTFNSMAGQLSQSFRALQQSESTNRAIVDALPDLLLRAKGDGTYIGEAIGTNRLQGILASERLLSGKTVYDSLPPAAANQRMQAIQQALQTKELQVYEQRLMLNGKTIDEEVRIVVIGPDEVLIMVRDITARKQAEDALRIAEETYRSIFENALDGIFQSTPEGKYLRVNPALAQMHGYESPDEMVDDVKDIRTQVYVYPSDRDEFLQLLEEQDSVTGLEYQVYHRDGSIFWVSESTCLVRDDYGKPLYFAGIVQDITERKQREEQLRRQLQELQIEIDHQKREQEVALITKSGYFQDLQDEFSQINLDEFWG